MATKRTPTQDMSPALVVKKRASKSSSLSVVESTSLREFRKTNEAIGLRVVEGFLSLLSRKVFNVMIFHAQELKEPGMNAPINTPTSGKYFWIPLSHLARDAAYNSKDTQSLKELLSSMQDIKLHMENDRQWTSERLVSSITLVNPTGLNKKAGQVWLGYAFPPEVHETVMSPSTYTRLSIVYQSALKSGPSLALYEICRRFATNPSKMTFIKSVEYWYEIITGRPLDKDNPPEYKYFKRDVLKPAMAMVNKHTDITVELIEYKNGIVVDNLQFKVELVKQAKLNFPDLPLIDDKLLARIMEFGFNKEDARDIMAENSDDIIRRTITVVDARSKAEGLTAVISLAAYFRWQLREFAKNPPLELPTSKKPDMKISGPTMMEKFQSYRANEALDFFKSMEDHLRKQVFEKFKVTNTNTSVKLDKGLDSAVVRSLFSRWYAIELWGEITAQSFGEYVENQSRYGT